MRKIGRYRIEEDLGRGAMGVVYLALDPRVGRRVALKTYIIPDGVGAREARELRERFIREAQTAGALAHPAIVTVYDVDEDPKKKIPYIAMEYVPGWSLKEVLASSGRLPAGAAIRLAAAVAGALHKAHLAGIVHRDVKPANILIRESDGAVKLADFGIARPVESELTRSGLTLGSPAYMSPEQIRGHVVDGRSDLFSLATVLYEALCGEKPFVGDDLSALAYAVVHETPIPASRRAPGIPAGLDAFFDRALAKEPEDRFPDGAVFRQGLREAAAQVAPPAGFDEEEETGGDATVREAALVSGVRKRRPAKRHRLSRSPLPALAVLLVVALGTGGAFWHWGRQGTLVVHGSNTFEDATLTLLVDGRQVYSRPLAAPRRSARMFGKKLFEYGQESFEAEIDLSPGRREVVAKVLPRGAREPLTDTAVLIMEPGASVRMKLLSRTTGNGEVVLERD